MKALVHPSPVRLRINSLLTPRARFGGPRQRKPAPTPAERLMRYGAVDYLGSHMPLDADIHWEWRNPLNLIPLMFLFLLVVALVAMVW